MLRYTPPGARVPEWRSSGPPRTPRRAAPSCAACCRVRSWNFSWRRITACPRASCARRAFAGIWASGLSISAQFGVRDNNEASWTQVVDMLEFMADASDLPILLDGDTGYGNFNNMRRLVRKLEQRGIAGVCIEDKQFPEDQQLSERRAPAARRHRRVRAARSPPARTRSATRTSRSSRASRR